MLVLLSFREFEGTPPFFDVFFPSMVATPSPLCAIERLVGATTIPAAFFFSVGDGCVCRRPPPFPATSSERYSDSPQIMAAFQCFPFYFSGCKEGSLFPTLKKTAVFFSPRFRKRTRPSSLGRSAQLWCRPFSVAPLSCPLRMIFHGATPSMSKGVQFLRLGENG